MARFDAKSEEGKSESCTLKSIAILTAFILYFRDFSIIILNRTQDQFYNRSRVQDFVVTDYNLWKVTGMMYVFIFL